VTEAARPVLLAAIFFGTLKGVGPFVRLVSMEWVRRFGIISYSVYLWQQLSLGRPDLYAAGSMMLIPIWFIGPAIISYWLIERPIIHIGHRLSDVITKSVRSKKASCSRSNSFERA
jgi:peptidoglycan/LPS O-acetylase OafA/YrhL